MSITKIKNFSQFVNENLDSGFKGKRLFEKGGASSNVEGHINVSEVAVMLKNLKSVKEINAFFTSISIDSLLTKFTEDARDLFLSVFLTSAISEWNQYKSNEFRFTGSGTKYDKNVHDKEEVSLRDTEGEVMTDNGYDMARVPGILYLKSGDIIRYTDVSFKAKSITSDMKHALLGDIEFLIDWDNSQPNVNILGLALKSKDKVEYSRYIDNKRVSVDNIVYTTLGDLVSFCDGVIDFMADKGHKSFKDLEYGYNKAGVSSIINTSQESVKIPEIAKSLGGNLDLNSWMGTWDTTLNKRYQNLLNTAIERIPSTEIKDVAVSKEIFSNVSQSPFFKTQTGDAVLLSWDGQPSKMVNIPDGHTVDSNGQIVLKVDGKDKKLSPNTAKKMKSKLPSKQKPTLKKESKLNTVMNYSSYVNMLNESVDSPNMVTMKGNKLMPEVLMSIMSKKVKEVALNSWGDSFREVVNYFGSKTFDLGVDSVSTLVGSSYSDNKSSLAISSGKVTFTKLKNKDFLNIVKGSVRFRRYEKDSLLNSIVMTLNNPTYLEKDYKRLQRRGDDTAFIDKVREGIDCTLADLLYFKYVYSGWDTIIVNGRRSKDTDDVSLSTFISMLDRGKSGKVFMDDGHRVFIGDLRTESPSELVSKYPFLKSIDFDNIFDMLGTNSKMYTTQVIKYTSSAFLSELYKYLNVDNLQDLLKVYKFETTATKDSEIIAIDLGGMKLLKASEIPSEPGKEVKGGDISPQKLKESRNFPRRNFPKLNETKSCKGKVVKFLKDNDCVVDYEAGTCKEGTKTMKIEKALLKFKAPESLIKSYTQECTKEVNEALRLRRNR